ncbi:TBPIP-domain-containing protein [Stipitochalara longipes BDJ]|nr:TBPIP-domain-containing protein [Stipitochalara longipes BDJ]
MAPRKPKPTADDDASSTTSELPPILKPKNEKAKVTKPKAEKAKTDKAKSDKPKAVKEAGEKKEVKNDGGRKADEGGKAVEKGKDGKEKVKAVTGDEAIELMKKYLKEQNRPYSATEVSANLHGKVTKTVADKLLKEMEQSGVIMGKATKKDGGGQWVFWGLQDAGDTLSPEQLSQMDEQITTLKATIPTLKSTHRTLTTKLSTLLSAPTTAALHTLISSLQQENKLKAEKLRGFKEGAVKTLTKEEVSKVEKEVKEWAGKRKKRMDAFLGLEGVLLQGPWTKAELWEKAGLEEDCYVLAPEQLPQVGASPIFQI